MVEFTWKIRNWLNRKKKKTYFRFFLFLFFELWSFFGHFCNVITPICDEFFTTTRKIKSENWFYIRFSTLRIFPKNEIKTDGGGGGVCRSLVGKSLFMLNAVFMVIIKNSFFRGKHSFYGDHSFMKCIFQQ